MTFNCFFAIQSGNYYFQLTNHVIRLTQFIIFSTESKKHEYEIKSRRLRSLILFFDVSSFIFKENHVLIEEDNPSEKIFIVEEELFGIDRNGIGNLEDLPGLVLNNAEC